MYYIYHKNVCHAHTVVCRCFSDDFTATKKKKEINEQNFCA